LTAFDPADTHHARSTVRQIKYKLLQLYHTPARLCPPPLNGSMEHWVKVNEDGSLSLHEETDGWYAVRHGIEKLDTPITLEEVRLSYPDLRNLLRCHALIYKCIFKIRSSSHNCRLLGFR
jgi:hypothetical protein